MVPLKIKIRSVKILPFEQDHVCLILYAKDYNKIQPGYEAEDKFGNYKIVDGHDRISISTKNKFKTNSINTLV